jgi:hypothetical protein
MPLGPAPSFQIYTLLQDDILTVTTDALSTARVGQVGDTPGSGDQPTTWTALAASSALAIGPFPAQRRYRVEALTGQGTAASISHDGLNDIANVGDFSTIRFIANAGVPDSTVGTNVAGPGSLCIDVSGKKLYINGGSAASPSWKIVTSA